MRPTSPALRTLSAALLFAVVGACSDSPADPSVDEAEPFGTVRGQAVSPGTTEFADLTAKLVWGEQELTAPVRADGTFEIDVPAHVSGLGTLTVEPGLFSSVHPGWALVGVGDLAGGRGTIVLAPTHWTPESGDYAGTEIPIDPEMAADTRVFPSYWGFYFPFSQNGFLQNVVDHTTWVGELRSWPDEAYPIPVALDHEGSDLELNAADSAAFWAHVDRMEAAIGWDAFEPATLDDVQILPGTRRANEAVLVRLDSSQPFHGQSAISRPEPKLWGFSTDARTWSGSFAERVDIVSADIKWGVVSFDAADQLRDQQLVIHEMMHTLGVGHGCSWASVQTYCASLTSDVPTPADVGHLQAMLAMRSIERETDAHFGVFSSVIGHRSVTLGLSPLPAPDLIYGPASTPADWQRE